MNLQKILRWYSTIAIFMSILYPTDGFIFFLGQAMFNQYYERFWSKWMGPLMDLAFGGPTYLVSRFILKATPIINPSFLGERVDGLIMSVGGGLLGFTVNMISTIVRESVNRGIEGGQQAIQGAVTAFGAFTDFLFRLWESQGINASIMAYQHLIASTNKTSKGAQLVPVNLVQIQPNQQSRESLFRSWDMNASMMDTQNFYHRNIPNATRKLILESILNDIRAYVSMIKENYYFD